MGIISLEKLFSIKVNNQRGSGRKRRHSYHQQQQQQNLNDDDEPIRQRQHLEPPASSSASTTTEFMTILNEKTGENRSRNTRHVDFSVRFAPTRQTAIDPRQQLKEAFSRLYARAFSGNAPPSGILLQFYPPNWVEEFTIPLRPPEQNSPEVVAEALMQVNEKYEGGLHLFDGNSEVRIIAVWPLQPNSGIRKKYKMFLVILLNNDIVT